MKTFFIKTIKRTNACLSVFLEVAVIAFMCVLFALAIYKNNRLAEVFGFEFNIVKSQSMTPAIEKFDFVVTYKTDTNKIKEGDVVVFFDDSKNYKILHRVNKIVYESGEKFFITKGDYNKFADAGKRSESDIYAKFAFKISGFGLLFVFLSSSQGISILIVNACNLMFMLVVWNLEDENRLLKESKFKKIKAKELNKKTMILNIYSY